MKLAVDVTSLNMFRLDVLVVIMVVCCMELTYFVMFRVDDVHFRDILLFKHMVAINFGVAQWSMGTMHMGVLLMIRRCH